jgi:hypothetical protein
MDFCAFSRRGKSNGATLVAHGDLSLDQKHTILLINGPAPELSTAYSDLGHRRGYRNRLVPQLFELARRKPEGPLSCMEQGLAHPSVRIKYVSVNKDTGVFAKG